METRGSIRIWQGFWPPLVPLPKRQDVYFFTPWKIVPVTEPWSFKEIALLRFVRKHLSEHLVSLTVAFTYSIRVRFRCCRQIARWSLTFYRRSQQRSCSQATFWMATSSISEFPPTMHVRENSCPVARSEEHT